MKTFFKMTITLYLVASKLLEKLNKFLSKKKTWDKEKDD